ncbi:MAG: DUF11 domain-containing protein [Candidatus Promineofilum sp.]|nr:DUF11 domain-containing protein [Promineifilum sp.]MBP9657058.1 DUF11 domain-containing protein [Promineifilum sp.]
MNHNRRINQIRLASLRAGQIAAVILLLFVGLVGTASAARTLNWFNWIDLNPGQQTPTSTVTVTEGQAFPIWVNVTLTDNSDWQCTRFNFTGGPTPLNTTNNSPNYINNNGTHSHNHAVTAPATAGTYDLTVTIYRNDDCTGGATSATKTSAVQVIVAPTPITPLPPVMQTYFVSEPEDDQWKAYDAIMSGSPSNNIRTHIGITIGFAGTVLYYDQWENGFDADITDPTNIWSAGNPGGTQIWGDGDPSNGAAPGFPADTFAAGDVVILQNMVPGNPRGTGIYFDGRDKIGASQPIAVTRLGWAESTPGSLLAYANAMFPVSEWGTAYTVPTGCNTTTSTANFEYSALTFIAAYDNTTVDIDADGNGTWETTVTLNQGQHYLAATNPDAANGCDYIRQGAKIRSTDPTKPIQVQLLTGDIGSNYAGRDLNLVPDADLGYDYLVPVGAVYGNGTRLFLFNPEANPLYVRCEVGTTPIVTNLTIASGALDTSVVLGNDQAAHCYAVTAAGGSTPDPTRHFTGMAVVDDANSAYDWAVPLMPANILSNMAIVGIGFGRDPFSSTNPNENGSPLWVTPHCTPHGTGSTWFYVDWNNDGTPDLVDFNGDGDALDTNVNGLNETTSNNGFQVTNGQSVRLFRPGTPPNQTGAYIYTKTSSGNPDPDAGGCVFAAAWGEDPRTASAAQPGMDLGTIIIPLRGEQIAKTSTLVDDNDGDGKPGPGDTLRFTISITNIGFAPIAVSVYDTIPTYTTYVAGSTFKFTPGPSGTQIPDQPGSGDAAFPLAVNSPIGVPLGSLPSGETWEVEFDVTLDPPQPGQGDYDEITNCALVTTDGTKNETCDIEEIVPPLILELQKTADPMDLAPNENVTYTIRYWNVRQEPFTDLATHLTVTDPLSTDLIFISATPTGAGSCTHDGAAYGGLINCTGLPDLAPATPPATPYGTITVVAKVRNTPDTQTPGHQIPNTATVCGVGATRPPNWPNDPNFYVCDNDTVIITTPVTVDFFSATETAGGVRFDWTTATETANAGFNLYARTPDGGVVKLHDALILSSVMDSSSPTDYSVTLSGVPSGQYFIEDVSLFGETRAHAAIDLNSASGERTAPEAIDWTAINAENTALEQARAAAAAESQIVAPQTAGPQAEPLNGGAATDGATTGSEASAARRSAYPSLDLRLSETGVYRLTYEQIKAAGVDLRGVSRRDLALTNRGESVPLYVSRARFGPGAFIEFIGQGLDTLYTDTNVYRLVVNCAMASRVTAVQARPSPSATVAPYYMETVRVENNKAYSYLSPNGDPWYDYFLAATPGRPASKSATVALSDPVAQDAAGNPLSATVTYDIWGSSERIAGNDHHATLTANGQLIADQWFDGNTAVALSGQLTNFGDSVALTLKAPGDHSGVGGVANFADVFTVEAWSVTYPRAFRAVDGRLDFEASADALAFKVTGLDSDQVVIYRLNGGRPARLNGVKVTADGNGAYSASFAGGKNDTYFVSTVGALRTPGISLTPAAADINGGTADLLIIAHPNFINGDLDRLVQARQAQGYTVKVVDVTQIYRQYSGGIFDAQAVRDYVDHAIQSMGVQYVLLVGGDTRDYRNYSGTGSISFVPSLYAATIDWVKFAPVDPLYTDVDGDNVPNRPIGRFPVRSVADLQLMVDKTLIYDAGVSVETAVFAADRGFEYDGNSFAAALSDWSVQTAYPKLLGNASARTTLINGLNAGPRLAAFVGHSGPNAWISTSFFSVKDAQALTNVNPMFIAQWGCWNTYYIDPAYNTLGDRFLLSGMSGAALVSGATTLTSSSSELALGELFMAQVVQPGITIGRAMQTAKSELANTNPGLTDVQLGWTILGDPTAVVQR